MTRLSSPTPSRRAILTAGTLAAALATRTGELRAALDIPPDTALA